MSRDRRARKISLPLPRTASSRMILPAQPGFAQQLTRETREAAGEDKEEKDKASFRQSASVRFIADKLGISTETASFLSFLFNFAVIAGIINLGNAQALAWRIPRTHRRDSKSDAGGAKGQ